MEDVISIKLAAGHMVYLPSNFLIYIFFPECLLLFKWRKNTLRPNITVKFYTPSLNIHKTISNCLKVNEHSFLIYS